MKQSDNETMKVAVAMSGGVDSSVVAKMMVDEGHEVVGLFLKLWSDPLCKIEKQNRCCDYEALEDARAVAKKLDIPFYVINAEAEFKREIVDQFLNEYKKLRTPNPCIRCNEYIKFDLLLKKALEIGCDKLATGHYSRIIQKSKVKSQNCNSKLENIYSLRSAKDNTKDQSYMLYRLNQYQLSKVLFPLGEYLKADVRRLAVKWDLPVKEKPESQEICFFGDRDYREFLKRYLDSKYFKPGDIVDKKGNVLGRHEGLVNYTIGQRRGIDQKCKAKSVKRKAKIKSDKEPLYVIGFNTEKNQLIVGEDEEVYSKEMIVSNINWIDDRQPSTVNRPLKVKIRYRHEAVKCEIELNRHKSSPRINTNNNVIARSGATRQSVFVIPSGVEESIRVFFDEPQRAVTPGQGAVFYKGEEVIGGGIIGNEY